MLSFYTGGSTSRFFAISENFPFPFIFNAIYSLQFFFLIPFFIFKRQIKFKKLLYKNRLFDAEKLKNNRISKSYIQSILTTTEFVSQLWLKLIICLSHIWQVILTETINLIINNLSVYLQTSIDVCPSTLCYVKLYEVLL